MTSDGYDRARVCFVSFRCRACERTVESWGHAELVPCKSCGQLNEVPSRLREGWRDEASGVHAAHDLRRRASTGT